MPAKRVRRSELRAFAASMHSQENVDFLAAVHDAKSTHRRSASPSTSEDIADAVEMRDATPDTYVP